MKNNIMWMKFYMCVFLHKKTSQKLYKFGLTKYMDVLKRFSEEVSISYDNDSHQYDDFEISCYASYVCTAGYEQAKELERQYLDEKFPKGDFIVETALGESFGKYSNMSGVTELRDLTPQQAYEAGASIREMADSEQAAYKAKRRMIYEQN
jgi:hypothetical protein